MDTQGSVKRKKVYSVDDNGLALAIVVFSGLLSVGALFNWTDDDRAKAALAVGASGFSGVIGYIGGKAKREEENNLDAIDNLGGRLGSLEGQINELLN